MAVFGFINHAIQVARCVLFELHESLSVTLMPTGVVPEKQRVRPGCSLMSGLVAAKALLCVGP
jgi:hypothetical protein